MPQNDQSKKLQSVKDKVDRLEKDVKQLKDLLNVQDNWHSEVRGWVGDLVHVSFNGALFQGTLKWIDRYTICLTTESGTATVNGRKISRTVIFPKSQIVVSRDDHASE